MKIYPLLLLLGCDTDDLRYPDAPVIDLVYNDETPSDFYAGILAIENLPYSIVLNWQVTVRGYPLSAGSDRFVGTADREWSMGIGKRYLELSMPKVLTDYTANEWLHLGIPAGEQPDTPLAIATSVTLDLRPYDGEGGPFNVGTGTLTLESTRMPEAAQWWAGGERPKFK